MKKYLLALSAAFALLAPQLAGAEGFAVYEWSAEGMAMGGARMFAENDAANMAYNPASITKIKGKALKASATYLSPHGRYDVTSKTTGSVVTGENRVHPAWVPGIYYVQQLNDKEWFGLGTYSRYGLVSQFERTSLPGSNAFSSKLNGVSLGANYARKFDNKWSASLGAEINYVGLQLDKNLLGYMPLHIEGESYALGWNAAANYEFDDRNEIGVVYRSKINHSMEADVDAHIPLMGMSSYGDGYGKVTLPESLSIGYSHKFNDKTRVELNGIWTRWDRYQNLDITFSNLGGVIGGSLNGVQENPKNWSNGWRYALGLEHKLSAKYSALAGIAYDDHSIPYSGGDFMIPTGRRLTYSIGTQYHDDKQTLALALGWMKVGGLDFAGGSTDTFGTAHTRDSFTKMFSVSYQRNF